MKIVVTGGHHNSALIVAEKLAQRGHQIFWFGHKYSMIGDVNPSVEFREVTEKKIPFIEIRAGKFQPRYHFWRYLFRIPLGFFQSLVALIKIKPDLIVSFGGYLALPVALSGFLLGITVVTHEQTAVGGLANQLIAQFAAKVFLTFPSSTRLFPRHKLIITGLPLRDSIYKGKKIFKNSRKTIYVTGGKQGSHVINEAIFKILPDLLENFNVIHQCGSTSLFNDINQAEQIKCSLKKRSENYLVKEYFFNSEIGSVFKSADFVIARSGAHTVYELAVLGKPAILIPIPWSNRNEQMENAKFLVSLGLAKVLTQSDLEQGKLYDTILDFSSHLENFRRKKDFVFSAEPAEDVIVREIEQIFLASF